MLEKTFENIGRTAGQTFLRGKWIVKTLSSSDVDSARAEYSLGKSIVREIRLESNIIEANKHYNEILAKLKARVKKEFLIFQVFIINSDEPNAFALPGGFIFITSSLHKIIKNKPDYIAFILAHEMFHVIRGHAFKKIITDFSVKSISKLLSSTSILKEISKRVLSDYFIMSYSRDNEFEADKGAIILMSSAGYSPIESKNLLINISGNRTESVLKFLSSHPSLNDRTARIDTIMKNLRSRKG